jgi:hypothetical protein
VVRAHGLDQQDSLQIRFEGLTLDQTTLRKQSLAAQPRMSLYNGPPRGGSRGGRDQFNWENVKGDKDREFYLGAQLSLSVHADGLSLQIPL